MTAQRAGKGGSPAWGCMVKFSLELPAEDPRFFIPGFVGVVGTSAVIRKGVSVTAYSYPAERSMLYCNTEIYSNSKRVVSREYYSRP